MSIPTNKSKIKNAVKLFVKNEDGFIIFTLFGIFLASLIGFFAIFVEYNYAYGRKSGMQAAADAAAMAGARQIAFENWSNGILGTSNYESILSNAIGQVYASLNDSGYVTGPHINSRNNSKFYYSVSVTPPEITRTGLNHIVTVKMEYDTIFGFSKAFSSLTNKSYTSTKISVISKAEAKKIADYCMIALNKDSVQSFKVNGGSDIGNIDGCGIAVNSKANCALSSTGSSVNISAPVTVVGTNCATGNPPPLNLSYGYDIPDPYEKSGAKALLESIAVNAVTRSIPDYTRYCSGDTCTIPTLPTGSYYSDIRDITRPSANTYVFPAGTYVFDCFRAGSNQVVSTVGVTIIVRGKAGGCPTGSDITVNGASGSETIGLNLVAPSSPNPLSGIALACINLCSMATVRGGPDLKGAIYAPLDKSGPTRTLTMAGNAAGACMQIIADKIDVAGALTLNANCPQISNNSSRFVVRLIY